MTRQECYRKIAEALRHWSQEQGDAAIYEAEKESEQALAALEELARGEHRPFTGDGGLHCLCHGSDKEHQGTGWGGWQDFEHDHPYVDEDCAALRHLCVEALNAKEKK